MTPARRIIPGTTYEITRRCIFRTYRLRPSRRVNRVIKYALARCASRYGIRLHAAVVLCSHLHLVLTDVEGKLPAFLRDLFALIARALNSMHGDWESFWAPGSYDAIALIDAGAVFRKLVYLAINPVAALLVPTCSKWPGVITRPELLGEETWRVKRPDEKFFRTAGAGACPPEASVTFDVPPALASINRDELRKRLCEAIARREQIIRQRAARQDRRFLGAKAVQAIDRHASPRTRAPRRKLRPTVSCMDPERRRAELKAIQTFRAEHTDSMSRYRDGDTATLFPYGTYLMRVRIGVEVVASPG